MSSTEGDDARGPRPPGWYPDPRDPSRHRHWDGSQWSELSATTPFSSGPSGEPPERAAAGTSRDRRPLLVVVAVVVLAVLVVGAVVLVRGGGPTTPSADPSTTSPADPDRSGTSGGDESAGTGGDPATTAPGGDGTEGSTPGGVPTTAAGDAPATPCRADDAELLGLLRSYPPLTGLAAGLTVDDVRCAGSWATAVVAAPDTDRALAVFSRDGSGWTVVLVGSAEPCAGLGIPADAAAPLGCGEW